MNENVKCVNPRVMLEREREREREREFKKDLNIILLLSKHKWHSRLLSNISNMGFFMYKNIIKT